MLKESGVPVFKILSISSCRKNIKIFQKVSELENSADPSDMPPYACQSTRSSNG